MTKDERAAELYMEYWQISERLLPEVGDYDKRELIRMGLLCADYPDPHEIVYNNEAQPLVEWEDPNFDWGAWQIKWTEGNTSQ